MSEDAIADGSGGEKAVHTIRVTEEDVERHYRGLDREMARLGYTGEEDWERVARLREAFEPLLHAYVAASASGEYEWRFWGRLYACMLRAAEEVICDETSNDPERG